LVGVSPLSACRSTTNDTPTKIVAKNLGWRAL
jgi:hypothetical protein